MATIVDEFVEEESSGPPKNIFYKVLEEEKETSNGNIFTRVLEKESSEEGESGPLNQPLSFAGTGRSYVSGLAGGAGGTVPDIIDVASQIPKPLAALFGGAGIDALKDISDALGAKGTEELTRNVSEMLGGEEPQNAVERILQQAGEFGGMEGLYGTATGGPMGGALGLAHGSVTGTFYGALKELGMDDTPALALAGVLTLSPVAARKLIPMLSRKSKKFAPTLKKIKEQFFSPKRDLPNKGVPPGGGPPGAPSAIEVVKPTAEEIEKMAVKTPVDPMDRGSFEKAEAIIKHLQEEPAGRLGPAAQPIIAEKGLGGRVTPGGKELGLRPTPQRAVPTSERFEDSVLDLISPQEVYNSRKGGKGLKEAVLEVNDEVYKGVNELYQRSRDLNQGIVGPHPELANQLEERIRDLKRIPARGTVSNQIIAKAEDLLQELATLDLEGNVIGYKAMNNQDLIDQIQEFRQIIDFDFLEGKPKNKFRPLIKDIQNAVEQTAVSQGAEEAVEALKEAGAGYRTWNKFFDNAQINPYRKRSNENFENLFNRSTNKDTFNHLNPILLESENGKILSKAVQREIVQEELAPFFKDARNIDKRKLGRAMRELESVVAPEIIQEVKKTFESYGKRFPKQVRQVSYKDTFSKIDKAASKITNISPEALSAKMDSRSGIRDLRNSLDSSPAKKKLFEDLKNEKILDLLRGGEVQKKLTGKDLSEVLNKTKNYELLTEMLGREEVETLRKAAVELGEKEASEKNLRLISKKVGKNIMRYKVLKLLVGIL